MNRNLSDCAAMACRPAAAVATVAAPRGIGIDYLKELYFGLREAGDAFGCPVVGGDTGAWGGKLAVSVTILGRSAGVEPVGAEVVSRFRRHRLHAVSNPGR
jgi:thiamine-monophosphate kinase